MAINYNKNLKKHKYNLNSTDVSRQRMKCGISCRSFILMSLSLYVISLFYLSSWNIYEENIVQSRKNIEIMSRNLSEIENESNNNMQRKNTMNHLDKTNESSPNSFNNETVTLENKNYNDMSKSLTEKELLDLLKSLEECPSKEDLINIWSHTVGVAKEGLDDISKEIKSSIQKHLDKDIYVGTNKYGASTFLYDYTWKGILFNLCGTVAREEIKYTQRFRSLINDKHTLDDILKFIYSFLEYFQILKKELHEKYQTELLHKMAIILNEDY
ncbi:Plasmodium exported protein (PHISTa), unknown function [Plasmodium sp. gorilla clade G2]|uniref:Plasmodium exported protein (PHISTa), unknown function n=1 Tax=Plasmodium sp. gorilla clade G2 TaxID=880535 RepID=UPI000D2C0E6D|nr:Plasmodium exported protein (PHISTa), unknown function [Plasmodium sp. gorilla clade G2]SOV20060.1 Plasmodium exported protein (PHISTa), unknown function [Plasmodium sp. gorilla clade G2]